MPEKAIISHRGEKYEIGRGKRFYGIWAVGAPYEAPIDRWPEHHDGWRQAWARFTAIEEVLRRFPVSASLGRYVMKDTTYRGVELKKGDHIIWGVGMYNFDAARFACPMDVKLDRQPNRHGTFGVGNHFCLGARLAPAGWPRVSRP